MNNKKNIVPIVLTLLVSIAAILSLVYCFSNSKKDAPAIGVDREEQSDLLPAFFADLKLGKYEEAMERISNYESLGFEKTSTELVELYKSRLINSYSVKVVDYSIGESKGLQDAQIIDFTYLDSRLLIEAINEKTAVKVKEYQYEGNTIENDEQALSFVYDALGECLETPEQYMATERITVQTLYEDGQWKIVIDETFLNTLYGHISDITSGAMSGDENEVSTADTEGEKD